MVLAQPHLLLGPVKIAVKCMKNANNFIKTSLKKSITEDIYTKYGWKIKTNLFFELKLIYLYLFYQTLFADCK